RRRRAGLRRAHAHLRRRGGGDRVSLRGRSVKRAERIEGAGREVSFEPAREVDAIADSLAAAAIAAAVESTGASAAAAVAAGAELAPLADVPRNEASRPKLGLFARLGAWFGFTAPNGVERAALASQLGTSQLAPGAPLCAPVGVPALDAKIARA